MTPKMSQHLSKSDHCLKKNPSTKRIGGWTYLKVEDDGPDEPEGKFRVAVDDILAADVDEFYLLVAQEPQRRLHVLDGVEAHAAALSGLRAVERSSR